MSKSRRKADPRIYDAPSDVTREVYTLPEYEAKIGKQLPESMRRDAERVVVTTRSGKVVGVRIDLRQSPVKQAGYFPSP